MNTKEFEIFLHQRIPITKAMGITVEEYSSPSVKVKAPLALNFNHKGTAFGGSINTLMTVCGWSQTHALIYPHDPKAHIVIQRSRIKYRLPITKDFIAESIPLDPSAIKLFLDAYDKHGKAKIDISVVCKEGDEILAEFEAGYVVMK